MHLVITDIMCCCIGRCCGDVGTGTNASNASLRGSVTICSLGVMQCILVRDELGVCVHTLRLCCRRAERTQNLQHRHWSPRQCHAGRKTDTSKQLHCICGRGITTQGLALDKQYTVTQAHREWILTMHQVAHHTHLSFDIQVITSVALWANGSTRYGPGCRNHITEMLSSEPTTRMLLGEFRSICLATTTVSSCSCGCHFDITLIDVSPSSPASRCAVKV